MTTESERDEFRAEVLRLAGDEVKTCIQCGTCSASCPTAHLMKDSIRKLVRLVLEGMKEEALESRSIWLCTSCLACTVRCPRNIRPMAVVSALKHIYEAEGRSCKDSVFEGIFARQIRDRGRVSELLLSGEYMLRCPESLAQVMAFGAELLPKGKIGLDIEEEMEKIEGTEEIGRIFGLGLRDEGDESEGAGEGEGVGVGDGGGVGEGEGAEEVAEVSK